LCKNGGIAPFSPFPPKNNVPVSSRSLTQYHIIVAVVVIAITTAIPSSSPLPPSQLPSLPLPLLLPLQLPLQLSLSSLLMSAAVAAAVDRQHDVWCFFWATAADSGSNGGYYVTRRWYVTKKCGAAKIAVSRVGTNCGQCGKAKSGELAIICGVAYDMM